MRAAWWVGAAAVAAMSMAGAVPAAGDEDPKAGEDRKVRKEIRVVVPEGAASSHGYLGVELGTSEEPAGARIDHVVPDSPADEAGLREGDVVVRFGSDPIRSPLDLTERIHRSEPGSAAGLTVIREGREKGLDVELGRRPYAFKMESDGDDVIMVPLPDTQALEEQMGVLRERLKDLKVEVPHVEVAPGETHRFMIRTWGRPRLGVQLVETTPDLRRHLGGTDEAGVLVGKVLPGTPAEKAGIKVGDLILTVDGQEVEDSGELVDALDDKDGKTISIDLVRDGKRTTVQAVLPEQENVPDGPQAGLTPEQREQIEIEVARARDEVRAHADEIRRARELERQAREEVRRVALRHREVV